ncbi:MAG: hypothetical protein IKB38_08360 [Clostridia bacterium]|nr:hypothetical protein [Clostridia bacterium]
MNVDFSRFVSNLKWMGLGMLGIFMIIGIIIASTYIISHATKNIGKKD